MTTPKDLTGLKFNRLIVIGLDSIKHGTQRHWRCQCECGNETVVYGSRLTTGYVVSCGCYRKEKVAELKRADLVGQRFGRLVVQSLDRVEDNTCYWLCICDCGGTSSISSYILSSGKKQSCGCLRRELARANAIKRNTKHGKTGTKVWLSWSSMLERCNDTSHKAYGDYGGRGITVCDRWLEFNNFYEDMGEPPSDKHSIDRIDNNKGYYLENCRWATCKEQSNNRRSNRELTINGKSQTVAQWAEELNINYYTLYYRITNDLDPISGKRYK